MISAVRSLRLKVWQLLCQSVQFIAAHGSDFPFIFLCFFQKLRRLERQAEGFSQNLDVIRWNSRRGNDRIRTEIAAVEHHSGEQRLRAGVFSLSINSNKVGTSGILASRF